jgi:lipopolysaccharide biosynthesis glycosyltransferase
MPLTIYLCAFLNKCYADEAIVCIESIRKNGKFTGDIYLFTDLDVIIDRVHIIKTSVSSVELSSAYRTRFFEHINYSEKDIILYLDTDIIIMKPLPTFDTIDDKIHVYGYPTRKQIEHSFSGFITDNIQYTSKQAFCAGILLFRPSTTIKKIFDEIYELYTELLKKGKINLCWEQPALCYKFIQHDIHECSLTKYVHEERTQSKISEIAVFNHFCGMRSNIRYIKMKTYVV